MERNDKKSIFQEDIATLKVYLSNNKVSNHTRQKLIETQVEISKCTGIPVSCNTLYQNGLTWQPRNQGARRS